MCVCVWVLFAPGAGVMHLHQTSFTGKEEKSRKHHHHHHDPQIVWTTTEKRVQEEEEEEEKREAILRSWCNPNGNILLLHSLLLDCLFLKPFVSKDRREQFWRWWCEIQPQLKLQFKERCPLVRRTCCCEWVNFFPFWSLKRLQRVQCKKRNALPPSSASFSSLQVSSLNCAQHNRHEKRGNCQ